MNISYNWLKTLIDLETSPRETADLLTGCGLEVESLEEVYSVKGGLEGLVIGEVLTCDRHPNADKLSLTTVNLGNGSPVQIVCGAPNVAAGQKVVVAPVGTTVHPASGEPFTINKAKIRGEVSEGMICAEDEISLGSSHAGIMVLPADAPVGRSAAEYFGIEKDYLITIGLTANRGDAASHLGVARDLAALLDKNIRMPDVSGFKPGNPDGPVTVTIEDTEGCARYSGIYISGITVGESPAWLKNRLNSIGIGPINNVVDCTNYVLHELGQPIHAFDAEEIKGNRIIVKRLQPGSSFITLDKKERRLNGSELMICNAEGPMAIAGIFGGLHSGVSAGTKNLFIESAWFDPGTIRKTARLHDLSTDASFRYERGTDIDITVYAMQRVALLITATAGGRITGPEIDVYPSPHPKRVLDLSYSYCDKLIGQQIPHEVTENILKKLGFGINRHDQEKLAVVIPGYKNDIQVEADLVEEVLRIYGLNRIDIPAQIRSSLSVSAKPDPFELQQKLSAFLCSHGFLELVTNTLTSGSYYTPEQLEKMVKVANPLSTALEYMRSSMLYSFLEVLQYNRNRKVHSMRFFEFGKTYGKGSNGYFENDHLFLAATGDVEGESWRKRPGAADYFYLKTITGHLFDLLGIPAKQRLKLAEIHTLSPALARQFDLDQPVYYVDISWNAVIKTLSSQPVFHYVPVPRFPEVRRDLSLVMDRAVTYSQVEEIAQRLAKSHLRSMNVFDVYEGDRIGSGKKAYAISFILQDSEKTMTDKEIDRIMQKLISQYEQELGAVIRK